MLKPVSIEAQCSFAMPYCAARFSTVRTCGQSRSAALIVILLPVIVFSCEKATIEKPVEAEILQQTCGGTVVRFISVSFGEEWVDFFDNFQNYSHVALTADLDAPVFEEGDVIVFSFKETNQLKGKICEIGGLPETKIEMQDIRIKN